MDTRETEHVTCTVCGRFITFFDEGSVDYFPFYEIKQSTFSLELGDDATIEFKDEIIKKQKRICQDCFGKILRESVTLRNLFIVNQKYMY
jgi:hypothetical protein